MDTLNVNKKFSLKLNIFHPVDRSRCNSAYSLLKTYESFFPVFSVTSPKEPRRGKPQAMKKAFVLTFVPTLFLHLALVLGLPIGGPPGLLFALPPAALLVLSLLLLFPFPLFLLGQPRLAVCPVGRLFLVDVDRGAALPEIFLQEREGSS
jgi:hypothetical protein